jgi:hypothetical protein
MESREQVAAPITPPLHAEDAVLVAFPVRCQLSLSVSKASLNPSRAGRASADWMWNFPGFNLNWLLMWPRRRLAGRDVQVPSNEYHTLPYQVSFDFLDFLQYGYGFVRPAPGYLSSTF